MPIGTDMSAALRLQTWLSPAFPIGAFSYSHGIEWAVEDGLVTDRTSALDWIETVLTHGTGALDGAFFAAAWRAGDGDGSLDVAELAAAMRPTAELVRESGQQGEAFLLAAAVWPSPALDGLRSRLRAAGIEAVLPVAAGVACRLHGIALATALPLYLQAFAANLVSAAVRLVPLGQTDGLRIQAALEPAVLAAARAAEVADLDELGSATPMVDWCSMRHETQYTRLFRS